jgi:hypothetical protein
MTIGLINYWLHARRPNHERRDYQYNHSVTVAYAIKREIKILQVGP